MRLNKFIALATGLSRREADQIIASGRIKFRENNTTIIAKLGAQVGIDSQVWLDNNRLELPNKTTLVMLNKPRGYVSSRNAQTRFAKTLYELLPPEFQKLKTVGRLDKDSSGLILLTDDGDLNFQMTHPKFAKNKTYLVRLDKSLAPLHQQMINDFGIELPDGRSKLLLEKIDNETEISRNEFEALKSDAKIDFSAREIWRVRMSEGRNRQIRRTFSALGYDVIRLHRTEFGKYRLGELAPGETIELPVDK